MKIEIEREDDGRWIAEIPELPGVMAYGDSVDQAASRVKALALRVMADRLEHGEPIPELAEVFSVAAGATGDPTSLASYLLRCSE